jgi:hypothetical protein
MLRCSSLIWIYQTTLLAPCLGPFGPATQRSGKCWQALIDHAWFEVLLPIDQAGIVSALPVAFGCSIAAGF